MKEEIKKRNKYTSWLIIIVAVFIVVTVIASDDKMGGIETQVFKWINNWPGGLKALFLLATEFGTAWALIAVVLLTGLAKRYLLGLQLILASGTAFVIVEIAKRLVDRLRPFVLLTDVHQRIPESGPGFPSGHTALAAAVSLTLALSLGGRWKLLPWVWITMVGLSRIYLGVHAPLDIIGGLCVGAAMAIIAQMTQPIWHKKAHAFWVEIRRQTR